jgi:hypothetical protein
MFKIRHGFGGALAIGALLLTAAGRAQESGFGPSSAAALVPAREQPVVLVLGASVSAGFVDPRAREDGERNSSVRLATALRQLWPAATAEIRDVSNAMLFTDPEGIGVPAVNKAVAMKPDLIVAVDFPFWFGYGYRSTKARQALQDRCFAQLDRLLEACPGPILIGDYPDMRDADPDMLPPVMVPSKADLAMLNRRLREFASSRPRLIVFPLEAFVASARVAGVTTEYGGETVWLGPSLLMQSDRLHASRAGVAVLTERIGTTLRLAMGEKAALLPALRTFEELGAAFGTEIEIEDWLDDPPETPPKLAQPATPAEEAREPAGSGGGKRGG